MLFAKPQQLHLLVPFNSLPFSSELPVPQTLSRLPFEFIRGVTSANASSLLELTGAVGVECAESAKKTNSSPLVWECACPALLGRVKLDKGVEEEKCPSGNSRDGE